MQFDLLSPTRPLDLVMVHGMCTHDESWAQDAVKGVYRSLGGDPDKVSLQKASVGGTRIVLYQQTLETARGRSGRAPSSGRRSRRR